MNKTIEELADDSGGFSTGLASEPDTLIWHLDSTHIKFICEAYHAQALLSQGEPMGYLRFKTINDVTFVPRDVRFVLHGASPHITTYPDLPLYLVPPSTEALQKDKAELIEYAKWLIEHLFIIKNSQDSNLHRNILSSIGLAKLAKDALDNPQPKCMQGE